MTHNWKPIAQGTTSSLQSFNKRYFSPPHSTPHFLMVFPIIDVYILLLSDCRILGIQSCYRLDNLQSKCNSIMLWQSSCKILIPYTPCCMQMGYWWMNSLTSYVLNSFSRSWFLFFLWWYWDVKEEGREGNRHSEWSGYEYQVIRGVDKWN